MLNPTAKTKYTFTVAEIIALVNAHVIDANQAKDLLFGENASVAAPVK
jgi:hypothetical protein